MTNKPVIFISATSDLRSARELVGKVLYSMGYEPVWQDIEATDGGELLDVLRQRLAPAALVIQLVGQRYGAEPPQPTKDFGRVSYTQFEALEAERLGKKVIYHFLDATFPTDPAPPESPELAALQAAYRQRLIDANRLRHDRIADARDLELSIHKIRDELATLRRQADRRHRKLVLLGIAALVGIAAVAALSLAHLRVTRTSSDRLNQEVQETSGKLDKQAMELAELRKAFAVVAAAVSPKPLATGQTQPDPIAPQILEKARLLLERGNEEQRALGMIALKQHEAANQLIQQLKRKPGNPIDEAFRLLTLEGDNWYSAGEPDKAIGPYEQAYALEPSNPKAGGQLALALTFARLGKSAADIKRAIGIYERQLKLLPPKSVGWAVIQNNLAIAWLRLPTGNKTENVKQARRACEAALSVYTRPNYPADWARAQNNLGIAWKILPKGNRADNLKTAIDAFDAALTVFTKSAHPLDWARMQNNLAGAWSALPTGDRAANIQKAIDLYQASLTVFTKAAYPAEWANVQFRLGLALRDIPWGNKDENLQRAIAAFQASLTVLTKDAYPADWARVQVGLGGTRCDLHTGNKTENVKQAIDALEQALSVFTKDEYPDEWAIAESNLGYAWFSRPTSNRAENLHKAIDAYGAALTVCTKDTAPADWAKIQLQLGCAWCALAVEGDFSTTPKPFDGYQATLGSRAGVSEENRAASLNKGIEAFEAAITIYTKDAYPLDWARVQSNLGSAWLVVSTGSKAQNLKQAIDACQAALSVYTEAANPAEWGTTQFNLGRAWAALPTGNKAENARKAIDAYRASLTVRTKQAFPVDWAKTQNNIGQTWNNLGAASGADKLKNYDQAIDAYQAALSAVTKDADPTTWARIEHNLAIAFAHRPAQNSSERIANREQAIQAYQAALAVERVSLPPQARSDTVVGLSWSQLMLKDFSGVLETASTATKDGISDLRLDENRAHALLLLGRTDEAQAIYLKHAGQMMPDGNKTWRQSVLDDFVELEKNGIVSPEFSKVRELLAQAAENKR
jgi:hypothetical protein